MEEAATEKQKAYLLHLLDERGKSRDEVDVLKLSKREARGMIHELLERETRLEVPSDRVFTACVCGVRTWEANPTGGPCWNCGR